METTTNKLKVYKNEVFEEKIEKDIELIARYVADTSPFDNLKITDEFDNLILSTIGFCLDYVYDVQFRNRLVNVLVPMQMSSE
ncbi:hypothetical protein [Amphibacillus indicireducens]|uniref:Phage gp6-like head-tail connector protein n=1 Tax=Amphibacillus indicireducens TaxID=1076330 RepID=A0ABP7V2Q4_9BACI